MALAFLFSLLAQRVPCVGEEFDADTLKRMQQHEVYLREQMAKLLLHIEKKNTEESRVGMQALLCAVWPYWKVWSALFLTVLLLWFTWKIYKKFRAVEDSSDEESSRDEEEQQKQEEEVREEDDLFLPDTLWLSQIHRGNCDQILSLFGYLIQFCQYLVSDTSYPVPQRPIGVGSAYESWFPLEDEPVFCLLVPLLAPRGHVFHLDLGAPGELPARNPRIRVELECTCGREQEMGMQCFLHTSAEELRNQQPSLLHSLCTGSYLDVEKTARWFLVLIRNAWKCMPESATCSMNVMLLSRRSCRLQLTDINNTTVFVEIVFGVQQDRTDIFLSSQETEVAGTPSTTWTQSCAVAEAKFFQHVATHAQEDNFYLRYAQVGAHILAGHSFSTYGLKTVLMHLLTANPLESWHGRYFLQRMDDTLRYLRCCVEEKRLDHFLIGNEKVPAEITLPQDFQASQPLNLLQHLAEDPDRREQVLQELEELQDQLTSLLIYQKCETSTCPTHEHAGQGGDDTQ